MARAAESLSPLWVSFSERPHFFFPFDIFRRVSTELLSFTHFPFFYREINPKPRKLLSSTLFFCYSGFYKTLFRFVLLGQIERKGRSSFALWCCGGAHRLFIQWPSQTLGPATREDGRKYCHSRNRRGTIDQNRTGQFVNFCRSVKGNQSVNISIVSKLHRTGFHFSVLKRIRSATTNFCRRSRK